MPDGWLDTLLDESTRAAAAVAVILFGIAVGGLALLNKWRGWWISSTVHEKLLTAETSRADRAEREGDDDHASQLAEFAERMRQTSEAHKAEMERLLKFVEALQREVESWRQAYHLEAAGNDAEVAAKWDRIEAMLTVVQRFVTEVQRHAPRSLESGNDGPGGSHVG